MLPQCIRNAHSLSLDSTARALSFLDISIQNASFELIKLASGPHRSQNQSHTASKPLPLTRHA